MASLKKILLVSAAVCAPTLALPTLSERDFTTWSPPGAGDVRSPCPAMNSLANHGFIPPSGKGLTQPIVTKGLADALNIGPDMANFLFAGGLLSAPQLLLGSFDLNMLNRHNFPIEHDVSLSRQDTFFGNNQPFNRTIFNEVLAFYKGMENATIPVTWQAKYARVQDSQKRNPDCTYGPRELLLSNGEAALYLSVLGDPTSGVAPVKYIKTFFEQERLPYEEGCVGNMIFRLYGASPEPLPEGLEVLTIGAYRDVIAGFNPVTSILRNATCALARPC
ncbi:putative sterigmatocystin biosynthesis peroxidase stcC [Fulvia fulva]|nr:putative sterigmatocystin biosynthesis peroxidase stcC [Fulvia fulva]